MALSYRLLETKSDETNASSYDSDDVSAWTLSPAANTVIIVTANSVDNTATEPPNPTISGLGLTWNTIDADVYYETTSYKKGAVWWAAVGGTPPSSGVFTVSYSGQTQRRCVTTVVEVTGADTSAFVASAGARKQQATGTSSSPSATVGAGPDSGNAIYGVCFWDSDAVSFTEGTSFTETVEVAYSGTGTAGEWDTTPADATADGSLSSSVDWGMLAFEIAAAGSVAITPSAGSVSVSTYAPTVFVGTVPIPPTAPTNASGSVNGDQITMTFTDNTSSTAQHRAYVKRSTDAVWRLDGDLAIGETTYTFNWLQQNTSYDVGVTAFDADAESAMSTDLEISSEVVRVVSGSFL
jgi:hypothetical protein